VQRRIKRLLVMLQSSYRGNWTDYACVHTHTHTHRKQLNVLAFIRRKSSGAVFIFCSASGHAVQVTLSAIVLRALSWAKSNLRTCGSETAGQAAGPHETDVSTGLFLSEDEERSIVWNVSILDCKMFRTFRRESDATPSPRSQSAVGRLLVRACVTCVRWSNAAVVPS
jgi:uncharacterized protein YjlB